MKTIKFLAGAAAGIFLFNAAHADILYVWASGRVTANGVPTPGVTIAAFPRDSTTRVPLRYDSNGPYNYWPNPQTTSSPADAAGNNYLLYYVDENGYPFTPPPTGIYFRHPLQDGAYFTPVDVKLTYSLPGYQTVTISADDVHNAFIASMLPGTPDRALGIAVINVNLVSQTVSVTATDAAASEAGLGTATFKFVRSGNTTSSLTVPFSIGGSATNGADYQTLAASVLFPAGVTEKTVVVVPIDDQLYEGDENVAVTILPNLAYSVAAANASALITDNDPKPIVTVTASRPLTIELSWLPNGEFTVSRTGGTTLPLTVSIAMSGSAGNGIDYVTIGGSGAAKLVTIPAGKSSVKVTVDPILDHIVEGTEKAVLTITSTPAYNVGSAANATVYILDDDLLWAFLANLVPWW